MVGFKKRLNESLQLRLSVSLSVAILLLAVLAGVFSFVSAFDEAHELQDDMLRQVAALFERQKLPLTSLAEDEHEDSDAESRVIVQYLNADRAGRAMASLQLPSTLADGLHTLKVKDSSYRVLIKTTRKGARIAVAQATGVRDDVALNSAYLTLLPLLLLLPILILLVTHLVRKMFRPIATLSKELDQRSEQELHPIEAEHLPREIRPFVVAINRLLLRVNLAMETQRRFVADAAHELRSPLTALSLQAERLAQTEMPDLARERLAALRLGLERGQNLLNQLLALAKAQAAIDRPRAALSVQQLYRRAVEDLLPLAEAKNIDLGLEGTQDAQIWGNELELLAVVKNLVDNAIRYTPHSGKVDLSVSTRGSHAVLRVRDSGPGIPLAERGRVFDPFYRSLGSEQVGSGLGLSIVKTITDRMGAEIQLSFSDDVNQSGLCVSVLVPLVPGL